LTVIGTTINVIPMSLVTTPDITTAQDLKGKTYGVSRFGSLTDLGLKRAVTELGLDPEKDIKMIQTGGVPENLLFMQQGVIKGALISSPTLEKAKELGYREFMNLANLKYRYPGTALVTTDSFIRSTADANPFSQGDIRRHQVRQGEPRRYDTHSASTHGRRYQAPNQRSRAIFGYIRDIPTVTHAEMEAVIEDIATRNPKAKGSDARQFYDPVPLEQLAKDGFIKELYPR
jgi:TRAP-type uncharacterized transport system substrate-binding protein